MPEASADPTADRSLTWTLEKSATAQTENGAAAGDMDKLPPRLLAMMAATSFTTWGFLAGSYELLF